MQSSVLIQKIKYVEIKPSSSEVNVYGIVFVPPYI